MVENYAESVDFAHNVVERITGRNFVISPQGTVEQFEIEEQLEEILLPDTSLFVEEHQNLWMDEHREMSRWSKVFNKLPTHTLVEGGEGGEHSFESPLGRVVTYATQGLQALADQLHGGEDGEDGEDGVLGWSSKARVWALAAGIISCTNAVLAHLSRGPGVTNLPKTIEDHPFRKEVRGMLDELARFLDTAGVHFFHPQLLYQLVGTEALASNGLHIVLPRQLDSFATKHPHLKGPQARLQSPARDNCSAE